MISRRSSTSYDRSEETKYYTRPCEFLSSHGLLRFSGIRPKMTMYLITAVTIILFSVAAPAETLALRDGSIMRGKLQSMDAQEVRIERCGRVEQYAREGVKSIGLESADGGEACGASSQPNVELPAGMRIALRILDYIDSQREPVGQVFRARLEAAIEVDGRILVSRGSPIILGLVEKGGTMTQPRTALDLVGVQLDKRWARFEPLPVTGRSLI